MNMESMKNVINEIESIKQYCEQNDYYERYQLKEKLSSRIEVLQEYCAKNDVPILIDIDRILDDCEIYSYEDDSSYYEEEDSW